MLRGGVSETAETTELPEFQGKRLLGQFLVGLVLLMVGLGLLGKFFHEDMVRHASWFVEQFGGVGVALGFFVPDLIPVPGAHEAFSAFGLIGGMGFWEVVAWASGGSLLGGSIGFWLGRGLRHTERFQRFLHEGRGRYVYGLMQRHGGVALGLAAVSPIPYSIGCWSCGALDYPFGRFLLISLLRIPRVAFYLWLIEVGFMAGVG